jgi:surface polysaccharide O-acyltransferase-like enzyme
VKPEGVLPLVDEEGWLQTRDLGHLENGLLYFDGRADDLINVGGIKVAAALFEERLISRLRSSVDVAVARGSDALRGETVVVAYAASAKPDAVALLHREAKNVARETSIGDGFTLLPVSYIPRTETHKVRRGQITALFDNRLAVIAPPAQDKAGGVYADEVVAQAFVSVFGESARDDGASFKSLGGDSLGYVMVAVELEAVLGELPEDWTGMSIAALIELAEHRASHDPRQATRRLPLNLDTLRAIACVLVVIYHVVGPNAKTGLKLPMSSGWHHFAESFEFIRMPLFTVMAGFLYAAMPATNEGLTSFLHRRAKILLVPLVTATIISVVSRDVAYGAGDNLIQAFIHGYMHLWFVYALMIWYIIAGLLDTYVSQSPRFWATMLFIAPVVWALTPMIEVISLSSALRHFVFFIFGILLYRSPSILLSNKILAVSAILAVTLLLLQQIYLYGIVNLGKLEQPVGFVAGCAIVLVLIRVFPRIKAIESLGVY